MYDPVLIAAILTMQVSQWTSPIIPGLQQTMFIPRESVSTSPSKTGSPGKAKPISSCQGIIGIHRQRCCIRSYQRISTARNCSSISIKHHLELLKLRGPLSCLMFFDHLTRPSHFNTYQYLHWNNYHIWSQCLLLNQVRIPKQTFLGNRDGRPRGIACDHDLGWHHLAIQVGPRVPQTRWQPQWLILWLCDPSLSVQVSYK